MYGNVTRKFDVLVVQNSVVVVQNNGKGKTKKRAARANLFLLIRRKSVLHVQFVFLLLDLLVLKPFSLSSPFSTKRFNFSVYKYY